MLAQRKNPHEQQPAQSETNNNTSTTTQTSTHWLLERAQHLPPDEGRIIRLFLTHLNFGRSETPDDEHTPPAHANNDLTRLPGLTSPEFHRSACTIIRRMRSTEFDFVIERSPHWPDRRRQIAWQFFVLGRSQRSTARRLACSLHEVRSEIIAVRALAAAHQTRAHGINS